MARRPRDSRMETREARLRLQPRGEPYWRQLVPGAFVGYRRREGRGGTWVARRYDGGKYEAQGIGFADDYERADGAAVLSYAQAVARASEYAKNQPVESPRYQGDGYSVNDAFEYYVRENRAAESSNKMARNHWRRHVEESLGRKPVRALTPEDLRRWHRALAEKPPTNRGKVMPFDPKDPAQVQRRRATANRVLTIVKAALTLADDNGQLPEGTSAVWRKVQKFELSNDAQPRMLDRDEIARLMNACEGDFRTLVTAALMTGARYGELCALRVRDFDTERSTVRIYQSKTGKTLIQPLTSEGARFLGSLAAGRAPGAPLLTRADGRAWDTSAQTRPMREAAARAGIEDVSFKVTRATYGKLLLQATADLELVAKALGHSDSRITRKHYAALLPSEVAAGIAKLPSLGIEAGNVQALRSKPR